MLKWLPLVLLATVSTVYAQEKKYLQTRQECAPIGEMMATVMIDYGETGLFTGNSMVFGLDGTPYRGGVMFFVNQDTGTWSLMTVYSDGTACLTALGIDFEPYAQ